MAGKDVKFLSLSYRCQILKLSKGKGGTKLVAPYSYMSGCSVDNLKAVASHNKEVIWSVTVLCNSYNEVMVLLWGSCVDREASATLTLSPALNLAMPEAQGSHSG